MARIKIRKKNIVKGGKSPYKEYPRDEVEVPSARGFKDPDSRSGYKRPIDVGSHGVQTQDEGFIARDRRFRRKYKQTTSSGKRRVPIKTSKVRVKIKAQPISKWKKGSPQRKKAKRPSSQR